MQRYDAVAALAPMVTEEDLFVTSMGGLWDDWWNLRPGGVDNTFSPPILGSHSSTALGLAVALPHRRIVALDTDGSILMNTGIMCTIGNERPPNLTVIIFDNEIYESIGSPPTHTSKNTDLARMAEGAGCVNCVTVEDVDAFEKEADRLLNDGEMGFMVAKIRDGVHEWPAEKRRPTDGVEDKYRFIRYVEKLEGIVIHGGAPQA
jgi:TPP-dependent trihydroxycyclohexane-1,2-dione (THcHDO) dehydratase